MTTTWVARLVACLVALLIGNATPASASPTDTTANGGPTYAYDVPTNSRAEAVASGLFEADSVRLVGMREFSASPSAEARRTSTTSSQSFLATEAAAPRFVVNGAGEALDTAQITIPDGKYGYPLEKPAKSGGFADSMGLDRASLDSALRNHLVDNFGGATPSVPMVGGGTKFSVTGPMVGPSGAKWTITTAWGVDPDGTIRLITATP